ncbi:hypothetical protein ACQ4PT_014153 [Festuca glaucescens]
MATTGDDTAQPPSKRPRHVVLPNSKAPPPPRVLLNPADCNLDFEVDAAGLRGQALHGGGFAYCWSGARATVGVRGGGRYCFGCRIVAEQPVEMEDTEADQRHHFRVGISRGDESVSGLGESGRSFGFGCTGKLSHHGKFFDYGAKFGVGDTIVCAIDLDSKPMASIGFSKNGEWLGIAHCFDASETGLALVGAPVRPMQWESAIFPHVLLKNVVVEMQFSREDALEPVEGYEPWTSAFADGNAVSGPLFAEQGECELLMMVGLPAAGKTTWAEKWIKEHQEKRFVLLGTDLALKQMKLVGLLGKTCHDERFDHFMDRATTIFKTLLHRASKINHNYIVDRMHLNKIERIRTLSHFEKYRKTAVVVLTSPQELKNRSAKRFRETWKEVPSETVDKLTATFVLPLSKDVPGSIEPLDEVIYVELPRDIAQRFLDHLRHSSSKHGTNVTSISIGSVFGWQSARGSNTSQTQSGSNAPAKQLIHPISAKDRPRDDDFIVFKKLDLHEEFESMDMEHKGITELSDSGGVTKAEINAAWEAFEARLNKCRQMQREISSAKGTPPIPDKFLN